MKNSLYQWLNFKNKEILSLTKEIEPKGKKGNKNLDHQKMQRELKMKITNKFLSKKN